MLEIEKVMANESVQNIFSFASLWRDFTVEDLIKATGYSKERIYSGINKLIEADILQKDQNKYHLKKDSAISKLQEAYVEFTLKKISAKFLEIDDRIEKATTKREIKNVLEELAELAVKYSPLLKKYFPNSIAESAERAYYLMERYK